MYGREAPLTKVLPRRGNVRQGCCCKGDDVQRCFCVIGRTPHVLHGHTGTHHKHTNTITHAHRAQTHARTQCRHLPKQGAPGLSSCSCGSREFPDVINIEFPDNDEDDGNDNAHDDATTTSTTTAPTQTPTPQLVPAVADRHAGPHGPSGNMCACPCPRACTLANTQTQTNTVSETSK